jgi:phosphatidylglycerol lysyltransferase
MVVTHLPPGSLPVYIDLGLTFVKIGEEARIRLMGLPLSGNGSGTLREILEQGEANGYAFEVIPRESTLEVLPELKCISDAWLSRTHAQERHFSVGRFDPSFLQEFPIAILRRKGRIHAFSNLLLGARNQALAPDLVRFNSGMPPPDPLELLLAHIILWGRAQGYEWCDLGLVPPLPLETDHGNTIGRAEGWTSFQHGECLESIQTIKQIEEKFHPLWEPRFLACPAGLSLPLTLRNHASLVSGRGDRMIAR